MEEVMTRHLAFVVGYVVALMLFTSAENQFATAEEAKALLEKAVVAVKDDKGDQNLNAGN
jgi:ABC-type methionine transport system permease subunit